MGKQNSEIPPEARAEGSPAPAKFAVKKLIVLGGAALVLLVVGIGAAAYFFPGHLPGPLNFFGGESGPDSHGAKKSKPPKGEPGFIYILDPFIVNLADTDQPRFLKIRINLEGNAKEQNEEFAKRVPQIKDTVLSLLAKKKYNDLLDSSGKERLKEEILKNLNPKLAGFKFQAVYYTEFVIQ